MHFHTTPIWNADNPVDLGTAIDAHLIGYRAPSPYALDLRSDWANAIRARAHRLADQKLIKLTDQLLTMLANPHASGTSFRQDFMKLFEEAWRLAYPLARTLLEQRQNTAGVADNYTLGFFDLGLVRAMEDDAASDPTAKSFIDEMLKRLSALKTKSGDTVFPAVFEAYSEAVIYKLLKDRGSGRLTIEKINDPSASNPDFRCALQTTNGGETRHLKFFVEVKALDIATAPQRLPELTDESLNANIELERQLREGKQVASTAREIAPGRRAGGTNGYDPWSPRTLIEFLIEKASNNFKASQFKRGPTFALANTLRLPVLNQGAYGLAPFYYDPLNGGACVSGVPWNVAFGTLHAPIHKTPEFEGAGTLDGQLQRAGLLVDPAIQLHTPGLILFHHEEGCYRFDGLYDGSWTDREHGWSNIETEEVFDLLCDRLNDRRNSMAHELALHP